MGSPLETEEMVKTGCTIWGERYSILILVLLFGFHFLATYFWTEDIAAQSKVDVARHLNNMASNYHDLVKWLDGDYDGPKSVLDFFSLERYDRFHPPLVYLIANFFNFHFGPSIRTTTMSNQLYLGLLILFTYLLGRHYAGVKTGLLAAVVISFYPGIWGISRGFGLDFPLIPFTVAGLYFLECSQRFHRPIISLALGIVVGLGILIKGVYIIYMVVPIAYVLIRGIIDNKTRNRALIGFGIFLALALLISSLYWFNRLYSLLIQFSGRTMINNTMPLNDAGMTVKQFYSENFIYIEPFSWLWFGSYPLFCYRYLGPFPTLIFVVTVVLLFLDRERNRLILPILMIIGSYCLFLPIETKWPRYFFPVFPAIAIVTAVGLKTFSLRWLKTAIVTSLFGTLLLTFVLFGFIFDAREYPVYDYLRQVHQWFYPVFEINIPPGRHVRGWCDTPFRDRTVVRVVEELVDEIDSVVLPAPSMNMAILSNIAPENRIGEIDFLGYLRFLLLMALPKYNIVDNQDDPRSFVGSEFDYTLVLLPSHPSNLDIHSFPLAGFHTTKEVLNVSERKTVLNYFDGSFVTVSTRYLADSPWDMPSFFMVLRRRM